MSLDPEKVIFASSLNAYKNTGVYDTSVTIAGGSLGAFATRTGTSVVSLPENTDFSYAIANYAEFTKGGSSSWQVIPTFDAIVPSSGGDLLAAIYFTISGTNITFTAFTNNPSGAPVTVTATTFNIKYVAYTLAN